MIIKTNIRAIRMFELVYKWLIFYIVLSLAACFAFKEFGWRVGIPQTEITIMGTALSILMGFRIDAAYRRWWEARIVWGAVVNNSRTMAREVISFVGMHDADAAKQIVYRQIGFVESMGKHLRKQGSNDHLKRLLSPAEYKELQGHGNLPSALLKMNLDQLTKLSAKGMFSTYLLVQMETIIHNLTDELGKAERIKNTPFPVPYGYFSWLLVHVFACLLPFSMVQELGYLTVLISTIISFIFLIIEQIAILIQNPFENRPNDVAMTTIAKNIEIDLREMLGEKDLPEPITPKSGISM